MISLLRLVTTSFLILYVKCHKLILRLCVLFLSLIIFQVQGLQYHLDILKSENLISPNWKDFDVSKWKIVEQLQQPIQKDRYKVTHMFCNNISNIVIHLE